jgi:hypothetical protein
MPMSHVVASRFAGRVAGWTEHGIAVAYRNVARGSLVSSQLYDYQKGGW